MIKFKISFCWTILVSVLFIHPVFAQSARLIVRGDDMGYTHSANEALMESFRDGIVTTIEVMPVTPWFPETVKLLNENPQLDVGIHLSLTSEWTNLKWRPLTHAPSLTDSNGFFYPMVWENENYRGQALAEKDWKIQEIEAEVRAQIELALKNIPQISHISSHMGWTEMDSQVHSLIEKLAMEYDIDIDPKDFGVRILRFDGRTKTAKEKIENFVALLETLEPGETYLFVDHPAFDTNEQRAINHIGYLEVAADRDGSVKMLTDPKVRQTIEHLDIQLINYIDLIHTKN